MRRLALLSLFTFALASCSEADPTQPASDTDADRWALTAVSGAAVMDMPTTAARVAPYPFQAPVASMAVSGPAVCSNGSTVDCNPPGSTTTPYVDPAPPAGFVQCAGFTNTPLDDVAWDWENNCIPFKNGTLFLRAIDTNTGAVIGGARLHNGIPLTWSNATGFNYDADTFEGAGLLANPTNSSGLPGGVSLAFHESNQSFCGCGRPGGGSGTCNDVFTASAANDAILYVGGNSSNDNYEAVWGPPGGKNTCSLHSETVRISIAIYGEQTNQAPVASAGPDQVVECEGPTTAVTLDGSASTDPDGDALTYTWSVGGTVVASGPTPTLSLPDGTTTVTLTVSDGNGGSSTDEVDVTVEDTTAPAVAFSLDVTEIWPPNHEMVTVATGIGASDVCDDSPSVAVSVTSNEAVDGSGDGATAPDWAVIDNGDGTFDVQVRAERDGGGNGRVYTVTVTATDASGNSTSASGDVSVPHSKGKGKGQN